MTCNINHPVFRKYANKIQPMKKSERRRQNLQLLCDEHAGRSITELAIITGVSRASVSKALSGKLAMSDAMAKRAELALGYLPGWLDADHSDEAIEYRVETLKKALSAIEHDEEIKHLNKRLNVEGKTDLLNKLYILFSDPELRELSPRAVKTFIGVINEPKDKKNDKGTEGDTQKP